MRHVVITIAKDCGSSTVIVVDVSGDAPRVTDRCDTGPGMSGGAATIDLALLLRALLPTGAVAGAGERSRAHRGEDAYARPSPLP
jgi:hypothetical protein